MVRLLIVDFLDVFRCSFSLLILALRVSARVKREWGE
jgi:hypothetical protein